MSGTGARNRIGRALDALPADGTLTLQVCAECGAVQYPPRERCRACLDDRLEWRRVEGAATVLAAVALHHSLDEAFSARLPWHVASVALDAGPVVFAHIEPAQARCGARVRVANARDASAAWCLVAFDAADPDAAGALRAALRAIGMRA